MSDRQNTCGNCRFFRQMECRKNPPLGHAFIVPQQNALTGVQSLAPQTIGYWPPTKQNQWCGAWEARLPGDEIKPDPEPTTPKEKPQCH